MYRNGSKNGLSRDQLEAARLGFNQYLRRKRFSPQFISRHAEDLFGQATLEYSRKLAEGAEIKNPPGWLIECAWRRTKSQLEAEAHAPRVVSTEMSGPVVDELGESPEDALLDEDRFRKLREAVGELSLDQRRILAHSYFEGFTVREAGRRLRWHSSKAQRAHEGAKKRLLELLGVDSLDDLQVEIGLAAYISLIDPSGFQLRLPAGFESVADAASHGTAQLWIRVQELARRFQVGGGTEPAAAPLGGNLGRTVGVCATGLACLVGGAIVLSGGHGTGPKPQTRVARHHEHQAPAIASASKPRPTPKPAPSSPPLNPRPRHNTDTAAASSESHAAHAAKEQLAVESVDKPSSGSEATESSSAPESATVSSTSSTSSASSSSAPAQIANEQFAP